MCDLTRSLSTLRAISVSYTKIIFLQVVTFIAIPALSFPAMVATKGNMMDKEFIERALYVAEQGLKVRSRKQVRAALAAIRRELAPRLAPNSLKRARMQRAG
jgi:hypothetical protein